MQHSSPGPSSHRCNIVDQGFHEALRTRTLTDPYRPTRCSGQLCLREPRPSIHRISFVASFHTCRVHTNPEQSLPAAGIHKHYLGDNAAEPSVSALASMLGSVHMHLSALTESTICPQRTLQESNLSHRRR
ncbi:hypothetical protein CBOM_07942 [Ceraceosorus bombacis]|uniref:Uncharacterized protein n=1 Tax=Ceraceosorus bombacis TaxID=401625 RepID=A0A0N7LBC1_9BASI|nr:hypothetical protein CBOM_07942 [Ceraceosorus bombacis]